MAVFQDAKKQTDQGVIVNLLTRLSEDPAVSQRSLADEMGVALGMMSNYMKSCVRKGYVRAKQVAPKRWAYFVTPKGFAEKSRTTVNYIANSMSFFRNLRIQLENLFAECQASGIVTLALIGHGDVAEVASLVSCGYTLQIQQENLQSDLSAYDAVLVTDLNDSQGTFDLLKEKVEESKILTIPLLCIARKRVKTLAEIES